ncbi:ComF family protein [Mucilaginibacter litoreus]|uniref:ComF family protein n=1 Tax=Mucilaginibacter litoreus TaxID=1048221 RepID=A0ABW3AWC1_9SPHI
MQLLRSYVADFVSLIFPRLCVACNNTLIAGEELMCTDCRYNLPLTNFHLQPDNIVARQFWGKLDLQQAYALYYFNKGGKVQNMVHQLKYNDRPQVGNMLGNLAGKQLLQNKGYASVDLIIPVPLHTKRLKQRGYNQSAHFAEGIAEVLDARVENYNLVRSVATTTQTHKSRFARFENMKEVFKLSHPQSLANKHVLLVDDIVTTGSTLEACGNELLKVPGLKLSIAAIAYAE